ncbi:TPA: GIY-YIG nuclease family protein [Clostridium botulinum]|nr:GIY-YIG nuclease family protein [Clostridium botulinum]HBJ1652860.1 GIY-YIG nuclease family protein [Clostridium botulinum]
MKKIEYKLHYENIKELKTEGVYLLRNLDNNKLKIGITNNTKRRLHQIEKSFNFCGSIPKLNFECFIEYKHNLDLEQFLHKELKDYNYQNEWFSIDNINLVLNKIENFQYKETTEEDKKFKQAKPKKSRIVTEDYKYYRYKFNTIYDGEQIDCLVYFKRKLNSSGVAGVIGKVANSMGYSWDCFMLKDWELKELNKIGINELNNLFKQYNTDTIVKTSGKYMRLDVYLGNLLRTIKIKNLIKNKDVIINTINNMINSNSNNMNIDCIKSDINNIEENCIKIQQYLNHSIEPHNRKNYKPFHI